MHYSFLNPFTHERASQMIATGAIEIEPLITREISLRDIASVVSNEAPAGEVRAIAVP